MSHSATLFSTKKEAPPSRLHVSVSVVVVVVLVRAWERHRRVTQLTTLRGGVSAGWRLGRGINVLCDF